MPNGTIVGFEISERIDSEFRNRMDVLATVRSKGSDHTSEGSAHAPHLKQGDRVLFRVTRGEQFFSRLKISWLSLVASASRRRRNAMSGPR